MLAGNTESPASSQCLIDLICEIYKSSKLAQLCTVDENKGGKEHNIP